MPYLKCLVFGCSNTSQFIKLYAFPKNLQLAKKWMNLCGQLRASNNRTRRICSLHFAENDFEEDSSKNGSGLGKILKQNCVPTLHLPDKGTFESTEKRKMEQVDDSIVADKKIKVEPVEDSIEANKKIKMEQVEDSVVADKKIKVEPVEVKMESDEDVHVAAAPSMTSVNQQKELSLNVNYAENMPKVSFIGPQQSSDVDGNFEATFPMISPPLVEASIGSKAPPIRYQVSASQPKPSTSRVSPPVSPPAAVVSTSTAVADAAMDSKKSNEEAVAREVSSLSNAILSLSNAASRLTQTYDNPSYCCLEASVMKIEAQLGIIYGMVHSLNNWRHEEQNKKVSGLKQEKK